MDQKRFEEMQFAPTVERARELAKCMINKEARGPGDFENARGRIEKRYGLSLWTLIYKTPKDIGIAAYTKLRTAYLDHCQKVIRRTLHDIEIEKAKGTANDDLEGLLAEAQTLLAKIESAKEAL